MQKGTVWRHPNLGIAYVAQHAFHHVEEHMEMSPSQYICWRYETGEDKEELNKVRAGRMPVAKARASAYISFSRSFVPHGREASILKKRLVVSCCVMQTCVLVAKLRSLTVRLVGAGDAAHQ